jgi:hypothetical protein
MIASEKRIDWRWWFLVACLWWPSVSSGQRLADIGDPPGRAGRISALAGTVSVQPAGDTLWGDAVLNAPLTTGDRLYAGPGGQAEVEIGTSTLRVAASTDLSFINLTDHLLQVGVVQGTLRMTVYRLDLGDSIEIDTPNGAITVRAAGAYRVDVMPPTDRTAVAVDRGNADVDGPGVTRSIHAGETVRLTGSDPIQVENAPHAGVDSFDQWSNGRDDRVTRSPCARYIQQ